MALIRNLTRADIQQKCFLLLVFLMMVGPAKPVYANNKPFQVLLFSGKIFLIDKQGQRTPIALQQKIRADRYTSIELTSGSKLFLQRDKKMLQMDTSGTFKLDTIENRSGSGLSNALQFLSALSTPRNFSSQVRVRGVETGSTSPDADYFNKLWEKLVLSQTSSIPPMDRADILAAAAWFHQQGKPAQTAYILEHLDNTTRPRNAFFQQLRNDSLRGVSLANINTAVENTRRRVKNSSGNFRYMALLIGINQYDHPVWQPLNNAIGDIRAIRKLLLNSYRFKEDDIISLENPTFSQIINGFHNLKKKVDPQTHLLIYYAGHGFYPEDEEEGYWIPKNGGDPSTQRFFIPTSTVLSKMKAIKSRHTLLIADSCFSGSLVRKSRSAAVDSGFYRELSQKKSRQIITSGGLEPVSDSGDKNHSVFAGNLLQILNSKRAEPLSASELAFQLRKAIKNKGVEQTPEYGRLFIADDENGEFFFVHKDHSLVFASNTKDDHLSPETEINRNGLDDFGMDDRPQNDASAFQADGQESWGGLGLLFHMGNLEYNYQPSAATDSTQKVRISASLEGIGLKTEYRRIKSRIGYGLSFDLGQFVRITTCANDGNTNSDLPFQTCDDEDRFSEPDKVALSGLFSHLGIFTDYSLFIRQEFSLQLGGEIRYQYYAINNFLAEDSLNSSTMGTCGKFAVSYRHSIWLTRFLVDVCLTTFEFGGSLHQVNNEQGQDVRALNNVSATLGTGFQF